MTRLSLLLGLIMLIAAVVAGLKMARRHQAMKAALNAQLEALAPAVESFARRRRRPPKLIAVKLARADLPWRPKPFWVGVCSIAGAALALAATGQMRGAVLLLLLGFVLPPLWLERRAQKHAAAFAAALPSFLDGVRQLLAVGSSLQQALDRTVDGAGPEIQRYFAPVIRRISNGASVPESLVWLANRLDMGELHMFAAAVQTNARFGGPISPVLINLTGLLRDRARVDRELRASTAEVRMTGWVLAGLPPVAAVGIAVINPAYMSFMVSEGLGRTLLMAALGLQVLGVLVMRRIMSSGF